MEKDTTSPVSGEGPTQRKENVNDMIYIGTKIVKAEPMDHFAFLKMQGKSIPDHENSNGYKVVYDDGYTSWSPANVFARCYRPLSNKEIHLVRSFNL